MSDCEKGNDCGAARWRDVREHMGADSLRAGSHLSYWLRRSPRRLLHAMAYYKFAAKLIGGGKHVLDVGCADGLGAWLLARECGRALGVDSDSQAIREAQAAFTEPIVRFVCQDFMTMEGDPFDALTSFDVIEHIPPSHADAFLAKAAASLTPYGVAIIGTPNIHAQQHASAISRRGHVNCYDGEQLRQAMQRHFRHVFLFAANDEVVHTGFLPMAHYLLALGCGVQEAS